MINRSTGQDMRRVGGMWKLPAAPSPPTGGAIIDAEVRAVLALLTQRLRDAGVFAAS